MKAGPKLCLAVGVALVVALAVACSAENPGAGNNNTNNTNNNNNNNTNNNNTTPDASVPPIDPALIPTGGVADAPLNGMLHVYVIDAITGAAIEGASVRVGAHDAQAPWTGFTDVDGLVTFTDAGLTGPQDITAFTNNYVTATFAGANGGNVTIPLFPTSLPAVQPVSVSGTIENFANPAPDAGFYHWAIVSYSTTDNVLAPQNGLPQPTGGGGVALNGCLSTAACAWEMNVRPGLQTHTAVTFLGNMNGTPFVLADDTLSVFSYSIKRDVNAVAGQAITNEVLNTIPDNDLLDVTVNIPTPPVVMERYFVQAMVRLGADDHARILNFNQPSSTMPLPSLTTATLLGGTYNFIGLAAPQGTLVPSSINVVRGIDIDSQNTVDMPAWLDAASGLAGVGGVYSWTNAPNAGLHVVEMREDGQQPVRWTIYVLDGRSSLQLPTVSPDPLPTTAIRMTVIAWNWSAFDANDFALGGFITDAEQVSFNDTTFLP